MWKWGYGVWVIKEIFCGNGVDGVWVKKEMVCGNGVDGLWVMI